MKKALISGLLLTAMLLSACNSSVSTSGQSDNSVNVSASSSITESTSETTVDYNFDWGDAENEEFEKIVEEKFNGAHVGGYCATFGYTDELNIVFTDYVNSHYGTNYNYVPFSEANYFRQIAIVYKDNYRVFHDNYEKFAICFMDYEHVDKGTFNNKLVMSYLIQNEIPFGSKVPLDNFKSIYGDQIYGTSVGKYIWENPKVGNFDSSYIYNDLDLFSVLAYYNFNIALLCQDERILPQDFFTDDPEYKETIDLVIPIYNDYLKKYFGENAPQIGQVMTKEQYKAIFGEDPLDLSYIPGAVVNK